MTGVLELVSTPGFASVLATVLLAGFLRGFVGFGAALVTVPVLSLVFGPLIAVPIANLSALPATFQLLPTVVRYAERPIVIPMALATLAAAPVGAWVLVSTDPEIMKIAISTGVVVMVALLARGWRLGGNVNTGILVGAGVMGGLVQGSAGIGGPPVVAVVLSRPGAAAVQRANVLGVITAISLCSLLPLWYYGLYTREVLVICALLIPPYSAATWVGARYFSREGQRHFRGVALATLTVVGLTTLAAAIRSYLTS